jgi:hypothetical protein
VVARTSTDFSNNRVNQSLAIKNARMPTSRHTFEIHRRQLYFKPQHIEAEIYQCIAVQRLRNLQ